jgi:hypothetical protein
MTDYKHRLFDEYPGSSLIFQNLANYYDVNYLATIFAPLYPKEARNCLWELRVADPTYERKYPELEFDENKPWTSSEHWKDIDPDIGEGRYYPQQTGA